MSLLISTSERTNLTRSSNLRNAAKAIKQISTGRILYKEIIASALQATNCSGWETLIGSFLDVRWDSKRYAPERILVTNGWSVGDGSFPNWCIQAMLWTADSRGDAVFASANDANKEQGEKEMREKLSGHDHSPKASICCRYRNTWMKYWKLC